MGVGNAVTGRRTRLEVADSYIVRIYRRSDQPGHEVAGLVEPVEKGDARAFAGRDELWAVLIAPESGSIAGARGTRRRRDNPNP